MFVLKRYTLALSLGLVPAAVSAQTVTQIPVTEVGGGSGAPGYTSAQSDLVLKVQQLQQEVWQLRGDLETLQYQQQKMEQEQRDRYRDIDRRLSALISAAANDAPMMSAPAGDTASADLQPPAASDISPQAAIAPTAAPQATAPVSSDGRDLQAYQAAFGLVRERRFDDARTGFEAFIRDYPASSNVANAWYWIGEIDLAQQKPEAAKAAFGKVVSDFPQHNKVADALYKLGVVNSQLGDKAASNDAFARVIRDFPQSSAAGLARNYMAR